jgi:hypothetical protein
MDFTHSPLERDRKVAYFLSSNLVRPLRIGQPVERIKDGPAVTLAVLELTLAQNVLTTVAAIFATAGNLFGQP